MPKKPGANSRIVIDGYLSYSEIGEGEMSSTASAGRRTIEVLVRSTCVRITEDVLPWMATVWYRHAAMACEPVVCVCFSCTAYHPVHYGVQLLHTYHEFSRRSK